MSIEETYKGMWSSDPVLLKSLLDAGMTIVTGWKLRPFTVSEAFKAPAGDAYYTPRFVPLASWDSEDWTNLRFLDPRPMVVEPSPLEWEKKEEVESDIPELDYLEKRYDNPENWLVATDGVFTYNIHIDGCWEIVGMHCDGYLNTALHDELAPNENFDTAKAAIHEWRVNHLKSMIGGKYGS